MNKTDLRIKESPIHQGADEERVYKLTTTPWGSSPSSPVVTIKDIDGDDVTATYTSGSTSVSGDVITMLTIKNLVDGGNYRLEVKFTTGGEVLKTWADLRGEM